MNIILKDRRFVDCRKIAVRESDSCSHRQRQFELPSGENVE